MKKRKILIAGGGIGGLAAAGCLLKAGHDVEVFEQAGELSEVGAGIQFSANAVHVLHHLGLGGQLEKIAFRPQAYKFRLHDTGEVIQSFPIAAQHEKSHGAPYLQVHRADVYNLLIDRVRAFKDNAIHIDHKVIGFEEHDGGVEIRCADGSTAEGDMLIGADGIKSTVREQLIGPVAADYTGDVAWRITVPMNLLPGNYMDHAISVWMAPKSHAVVYYLRGGALANFVGIVEADDPPAESWTTRESWNQLKADFAGWHDRIQVLIDNAARDECYRWALHIRKPIERWSSATVTLLGDAAHPTLPYLAQGAAMALEDAAIIARALDQAGDVAAALQLYERNRAGRAARIVTESSANRGVFHARSVAELREVFRNRNMGRERNGWLYSYNPLQVSLTK